MARWITGRTSATLLLATVAAVATAQAETVPNYDPSEHVAPWDFSQSCCRVEDPHWQHTPAVNVQWFFAADAWRSKPDDDRTNNFGLRTGVNTAFEFGTGWGYQIGFSYGAYDWYGRELGNEEAAVEEQLFATTGFYYQGPATHGWPQTYGAVLDLLSADNLGEEADEVFVSQLRGRVGWSLGDCDEVGLLGSWRLNGDHADSLGNGGGVTINPIDQWSLYWQHDWATGGQLTCRIGLADDPGDVLFGVRGTAPVSPQIDFFGSFDVVTPSTSGGDNGGGGTDNRFSEETWNISFGMVYYYGQPRCPARCCDRARWPLFPVADNGSFALQAPLGSL